jgi:hypothetical protein
MGLTQTQLSIISKAREVGGGKQGVALSDEACAFLVSVIARDMNLADKFPEFPKDLPTFFSSGSLESLVVPRVKFLALFERAVGLDPNADTYFSCLAALHKARLKYERIMQTQPVPTIDQIGPRGLLQFGTILPKALTPFLLWRKWIFDVDNRAGQETGYVFEPIIAHAVGGVSVSAKKSPIKRHANSKKGRQCDCILNNKRAYEFKLRVTIAASGQGRWKEELDFPTDCKASGYTPVLIVLDPTPNPKLEELKKKFQTEGGEVYIGNEAWKHLGSLAGTTMSRFPDLYVHAPIQGLLAHVPENKEALPDLLLKMSEGEFSMTISGETLHVKRQPKEEEASDEDALPDDVEDEFPGA